MMPEAASASLSYPAEAVAWVEMHSPPMNFGSYALIEAVERRVEEAKAAGCKAVVLTSSLPGYFMAHAWLPDPLASFTGGTASGDPRSWRRLTNELERGPMVSIAAVNGQAWGGGAEICWACNLRVAAESATFGQPEVMLGAIPGAGGSTRLPRLVGLSRAFDLVLSGEPITAAVARAAGLVTRVVPDAGLQRSALALAKRVVAQPAAALQTAKAVLLEGYDLPFEKALRLEGRTFVSLMTPQTLDIWRKKQAEYDAGEDSYQVFGVDRPRDAAP